MKKDRVSELYLFFRTLINARRPAPHCGTLGNSTWQLRHQHVQFRKLLVLMAPCVPKTKGPFVQCPLSDSGPGRQETCFFIPWMYGLTPYGSFCKYMEGCARRTMPRTGLLFIVWMMITYLTSLAWIFSQRPPAAGEGDWAFFFLRLFLQLKSVRWHAGS